MPIYNFDMKNLLALFGNNPEALANEFTKQLNTELKKKTALEESSKTLCESWKSFLESYFELYPLPNGLTIEDFYFSTDELYKIIEWIMKMIPQIHATSTEIKKVYDDSKIFKDWITKYTK